MAVAMLIWLGWTAPACASLHDAVHLIEQAQRELAKNSVDPVQDPHLVELLNSALESIDTAPSSEYIHGSETKTMISGLVQAARSDLQADEAGNAKQDMAQAIAAINKDLLQVSFANIRSNSFFDQSPSPPSNSPVLGTWTGTIDGATSTLVFAANGAWTETWKGQQYSGTWRSFLYHPQITVIRSDRVVLIYTFDASKNLVRNIGNVVYQPLPPPSTPTPVVADHPAPTVKLTEDQARAVVVIKGDNAEGTGFLVKMPDGPVVITNIHVISNNPHLQITTNTGTPLMILSYKGATDRDLAMISVKDGSFSYLTLAADVAGTVQPSDEVITPGNSEGGDVVLNTDGKVLGVGPDRIEFDNPVYHGNSGGPVFQVKSNQVIGVVTEAIKVDVTDELDKASFANRNSAIGRSMRYFGLRLDTAHNWETYDWNRFQIETLFLDQFEARNRSLDTYLNAPDDAKPEDNLWRSDDPVVKANNSFNSQLSGTDTAQQLDAARQWLSDMFDLANANMDAIQEPRNFYTFDQQRAKDALAYRKALKAELDTRSNNLSQLASMPRRN